MGNSIPHQRNPVKTQYLIELTQQQLVFVSVVAENEQEAFELVLQQKGNVTLPYPPELIQGSLRIVRKCES